MACSTRSKSARRWTLMSPISWVMRNASSRFCLVSLASSNACTRATVALSASDVDATRTVPVSSLARISSRNCCSSATNAGRHCWSPACGGTTDAAAGVADGVSQPVETTKPSGPDLTCTLAMAALTASTRMAATAWAHTGTVFHHCVGGSTVAAGTGAAACGGAPARTMSLVPLSSVFLATTVKPNSALGAAHCVSSMRTPARAPTSAVQAAHCRRCSSTRCRSCASISS